MTYTTATVPGQYDFGQADALEAAVVKQLRHQRETWDSKKLPYMVNIYIDPRTNTALLFAGNPAGKVKE